MPEGRRKRRRTTRRKAMRGGDFKSVLGKINNFLKEHKIISRGANALSGILPGRWGSVAGTVGSTAAKLGYGHRRKLRTRRLRR